MILFMQFLAHFAAAQSISELSLAQVLELSLARTPSSATAGVPGYQSSSWLAALPTFSASYLNSDERYGVDETELSFNLPIKSSRRRESDRALQGLEAELDEIVDSQRSLYFSGLIREAVWSYQLAHTNSVFATRKLQLLLQLEQRHKDLLRANATSQYAVLLIQKELVTARIKQQEQEEESRRWLLQFRYVTGLGSMPQSIEEPAMKADEFTSDRHPMVRQLQLVWSQKKQLLLANSDQASSWNLSVNAKNLDAAGYDENQYGLAVEVPLNFIKIERQSHNSEWREENRKYHIARDKMVVDLHTRWQMLVSRAKSLRQKQKLLLQSSQLSEQISEQVTRLQAGNEIGQEIALRRLMEATDTQADVALNQIQIHQNNAMLRQAAGHSL
jgi:hypothetical protein